MVTDQTTMKPAEGPNQAKINPAGQVLTPIVHCTGVDDRCASAELSTQPKMKQTLT
jgi:hypothetical protein